MENERVWQVTFFGEGATWTHGDLTFHEAEKVLNDCPKEYAAYIEPM